MITLAGSQGTARFTPEGYPLRYEPSDYPEISKLDIEEWCRAYPGENPDGEEHDVLDWGWWDKDGDYNAPEYEWRRDRLINIMKDKLFEAQALLDRLESCTGNRNKGDKI